MEDSGIDSEDKISTTNFKYVENENESKDMSESNDDEDDKDDSSNSVEVIFKYPENKNSTKNAKQNSSPDVSMSLNNNQLSTCRILQRKLELKVERAKKNYNRFQAGNSKKLKSSNLIPISRLPIPGYSYNKPLVEYKSESEEGEDISFFPTSKVKNSKKQELTDTFSIQEMCIETDNSDDSESQNLELLPPSSHRKCLDKLLSCFYCSQTSAT